MRALCGCRRVEEAAALPEREADAQRTLGLSMAVRWGCPRAGCTPRPLTPDLAEAAGDWSRTTGQPAPATCPYARGLTPWGREVVRAYRLTSRLKGGLTAAQALGREPHAWDVAALDAVLLEMDAVSESDEREREREREQRRAEEKVKQWVPG